MKRISSRRKKGLRGISIGAFHQNRGEVIHRLKRTETLTWEFLYKMEDDQEVLDLFVAEFRGRLNCYVYKRDSQGWKLDYSKENDEISRYLRRVYSDGKYVTDDEIADLMRDNQARAQEGFDLVEA